jgi:nucleoside phosphorylase
MLLCSSAPIYCSLSSLWESSEELGGRLEIFARLVTAQLLETVSRHSTVAEFVSSRLQRYWGDADQYPMYFSEAPKVLFNVQPTVPKDDSATDFITQDVMGWLQSSALDKSICGSTVALRQAMLKRLLAHEDRAITVRLFASGIAQDRRRDFLPHLDRRISQAYIKHYLRISDGDIVTGIQPLAYFDSIARLFPMYDYQVLDRIARILPVSRLYLAKPSRDAQDILAWRSLSEHALFTNQLRTVLLNEAENLSKSAEPVWAFASRSSLLKRLEMRLPARVAVQRGRGPKSLFEQSFDLLWAVLVNQKNDPVIGPAIARSGVSMPRFEVLLVTATPVESKAVLDVFERGRKLKRRFVNPLTFHELTPISGCRVALVESEIGAGGVSGSILTTSDAISAVDPVAIICVGVAFGMNPEKQKLGDILVSRQVLQYELQRRGEDSAGNPRIVPRGDKTQSSARLLNVVRSGIHDWKGADVKFGLVLSGEKLVDSKLFKQELLQFAPEAIGGDMETAGVYSAASRNKVDWISVKAICDWADGGKGDSYQVPAATNAAQFVLHVLETGAFAERP